MTKKVLKRIKGGAGSVIAFHESAEERTERIAKAAEDSRERFVLTAGQRRTLARMREQTRG